MRDTARHAAEAQRLMDEPLLNEALSAMEEAAFDEILRVPVWSKRRHMALVERIRAIRGIRSHLRSVVMNGQDGQRTRVTVA